MGFASGIRATLARWFGGGGPAPARTLGGAAFAWRGWLSTAWVWPRRRYRFHIPAGASRFRAMPLIVLLHGCRQSADEIARGTRIEALADRLGAYVLMPEQSERANPYRCWNWFDPVTAAGRGEAAIVLAAMTKAMIMPPATRRAAMEMEKNSSTRAPTARQASSTTPEFTAARRAIAAWSGADRPAVRVRNRGTAAGGFIIAKSVTSPVR